MSDVPACCIPKEIKNKSNMMRESKASFIHQNSESIIRSRTSASRAFHIHLLVHVQTLILTKRSYGEGMAEMFPFTKEMTINNI